jgi:Fe-S-cluster containining protein
MPANDGVPLKGRNHLAKKKSPALTQGNGALRSAAGAKPPAAFVALSMLTAPYYTPMPKQEDGPPCHLCTARCCKYFALQIDKPKTREEYDHIRWYLMHEGIAVWKDDGDWYLEIRTVCKLLQPDYSCGIYETRPQICREYGSADEPCEYFTDHLRYDLYFDSDDKFAEWAEAQLAKRKGRKRTEKSAA